MGTLHETKSYANFANWSKELWDNWNKGFGGRKGTNYRKDTIKQCSQRLLRTVGIPMCAVTTTEGTSYGGCTNPGSWSIDIEGEFKKTNITLAEFSEIMKTAYHECRHIEQMYRIVQAVHLGYISWNVHDSNYKKVPKPANGQEFENAMGVNAAAANHAIRNISNYQIFCVSPSMSHCVKSGIIGRPNDKWTNTVSNWFDQMMSSTRMRLYNQTAKPVQYLANYRNSEVDKDTFALENVFFGYIKAKWVNYLQKKNSSRISTVFPQP